jgi:hypothetical protein
MSVLVVNDFFDVGEKHLRDFAVVIENFYGWLAERLRAAQVIDFTAHAASVVGYYLYVLAVEQALQPFHHCKEISHGFLLKYS